MKMLHKVWKKLIWVWNKCQGYEKSAWWYETNDKCSETNTHLKDAHIVLLTDFFRTVFVWCGFVLYLSGRYLCGVGLFCTICTVFKSIHIQLEPHSTFFTTKTGRKLYCVPIIADHKWVCFVLLKLFLYQPHPLSHIVLLTDFFRTVYVWCGFVLYLSGRYLCGVGLFCTIVD